MRKYELLDQVLEQFSPSELADYIFMNDKDYCIDLMDNVNWNILDEHTTKMEIENNTLIVGKETRICDNDTIIKCCNDAMWQ